MDDNKLYKDPPRLILDLMIQTFGNQITTYYLGAPTINPPEAAYPVCVVHAMQSSNTKRGAATGTDNVGQLVHIIFLENSKDDANNPDSENQNTTMRKLYNKIEGRDPTTGFYLPGTAKYALRKNITLQSGSTGFQTTLDHDISADYDIIPRGERPAVVEAIVTVTTRERVMTPESF